MVDQSAVVNSEQATTPTTENRLDLINRVRNQRRALPKFVRDPIHDLIRIDDQVILDILDSRAMQRLKRIRQLGTTAHVFPAAEHSRFAHSLGTYHVAGKMLDQIQSAYPECGIDDYHRLVVELAALLHDVGHGPFSHLFEQALQNIYDDRDQWHHEAWTKRIIYDESSDIRQILDRYGECFGTDLASDVKSIIDKTFDRNYLYLCDIVSSQFDADRFDYMLRDSHMAGVNYGKIDLTWLLRNLTLFQGVSDGASDHSETDRPARLVINIRRGLSILQQYLLGNLYMYRNVYWHKTVLSADAMILSLLKRVVDLIRQSESNNATLIGVNNVAMAKLAEQSPLTVDEYLCLDDNVILSWMQDWQASSTDPILRQLSREYMSRQLFKPLDIYEVSNSEQRRGEFINKVIDEISDSAYFAPTMEYGRLAYRPLAPDEIYLVESEGAHESFKYSDYAKIKDDVIDKVISNKIEIKGYFLCYHRDNEETIDTIRSEYQ